MLTLGAGREVLPAVTKMQMRMTPSSYTHGIMCIYACAVLLIGGRAGRFTDLLPACCESVTG